MRAQSPFLTIRGWLLGSPASYEKTPFRTKDVSSDAVTLGQNVRAAGQDLRTISDLRAASFLGKFPNTKIYMKHKDS